LVIFSSETGKILPENRSNFTENFENTVENFVKLIRICGKILTPKLVVKFYQKKKIKKIFVSFLGLFIERNK
jgi:hypothetical protein